MTIKKIAVRAVRSGLGPKNGVRQCLFFALWSWHLNLAQMFRAFSVFGLDGPVQISGYIRMNTRARERALENTPARGNQESRLKPSAGVKKDGFCGVSIKSEQNEDHVINT